MFIKNTHKEKKKEKKRFEALDKRNGGRVKKEMQHTETF